LLPPPAYASYARCAALSRFAAPMMPTPLSAPYAEVPIFATLPLSFLSLRQRRHAAAMPALISPVLPVRFACPPPTLPRTLRAPLTRCYAAAAICAMPLLRHRLPPHYAATPLIRHIADAMSFLSPAYAADFRFTLIMMP